jgi:hypothetical protein
MPKKASTPPAAAPAVLRTQAPAGNRKAAVAYSQDLAEKILDRIAAGARWKTIAGKRGMPAACTLYRWEKRDPEFAEALAAARRAGAEWRADAVLDVAEAATKETVQVDRLHIGALKWRVDRDTKIYGLKPDEPDLGAGRKLIIEVRRFERFTDDDGVVRVRELLPAPAAPDEPA